MTRDQMVSDHAGLVCACAHLMTGRNPDWVALSISEDARKQIIGIVDRHRKEKHAPLNEYEAIAAAVERCKTGEKT